MASGSVAYSVITSQSTKERGQSSDGVVTTIPLPVDYRNVVSESGEKLPAAIREKWLKIENGAVGAKAVKEIMHAD